MQLNVKQISFAQGTITAAAPNISASVTWNSGATTFTGWLLSVTDTSSAAASLLIDMQVGGASKFSVTKNGTLTVLRVAGGAAGSGTQLELRGDKTTSTAATIDAANSSTWVANAGTQVGLRYSQTVNQTATAGYDAFQITMTHTGVGSGTKNVINALVAAASVYSVSSTGLVTSAQQLIAQGTITAAAFNIQSTVTWNSGATTFSAWQLNVTNTASAAASLLLDLQVGGVTRLSSQASNGSLGINTNAPGATIDMFGNEMLAGADTGGTIIRTDGNIKRFFFSIPHSTAAQGKVLAFLANSGGGVNTMGFGGGDGAYKAATSVTFYTAANTTTTTGSERLRIENSGKVGVGADPATLTGRFGVRQSLTTTAEPNIYGNPTWNDAGTTHIAWRLNVTNTASAVASLLLDLQVGAATKFGFDVSGRMYGTALHNNAQAITGTANQYVASGTYTPALTNVTNVTASTARKCQYMRVGNVVTVSGSLDITPTLAALATIGISLPIASNLALATDCAGNADAIGVSMFGSISGDAANDRAQLDTVAIVGANTLYFSFSYEIL